ncbi:MAG: tetratricopeptide repeat protein [Candidatus Eisenbacteria bacterium]
MTRVQQSKGSPRVNEAAWRAVLRARGWQIALLVVVTLLAYLPAFSGGWVWDDDEYVLNNPTLASLSGLGKIWFDPSTTPQYYPLVFTTFWVDARLFGLDARGYHASNVFLHAAVAVLLLLLLDRLRVAGAWAIALLFAVHPVHVESVAWITERKNVLSALFYFGAALSYLRFDPPEGSEAKRDWRPYGVALGLFVLALLAKTTAVSLAPALLLILWWKRGRLEMKSLAPLTPFFAIGVLGGALTASLEHGKVGAQGAAWSLHALERVVLAGRAFWFYPMKLLLPHPLVFIYPRWQISVNALQLVAPLTAAAALIALFALRARLGKGPVVAALFYAAAIFPALGFFNVYWMRFSYVADHFQYLGSIGILALLVAAWRRVRAPEQTALDRPVAAVVVLALALLTARQASVYRSGEDLWRDTLAKNDQAWIAHNNLGFLLANTGRGTEAEPHYRAALQLYPDFAEAHNNLATLRGQQGRFDEAIAACERAIAADPKFARAYFNRALAEFRLGRHEEALRDLDRFEELSGPYARARLYRGLALQALGRTSEAIAAFDASLTLDPNQSDVRAARAKLVAGSGVVSPGPTTPPSSAPR